MIEYMGTLGFFAPWFYWEYYTTLGPMFMGKVPYLIPLTWLTFMYCAWTLANLIFNKIRTNSDEIGKPNSLTKVITLLIVSLCSGLIMTAWDLINDPVMVARGYWSWPIERPIEYFGIPLGNNIGWIAIASITFLVYNIYLGIRGHNQIYYQKEGVENSQTTLMVIFPYLLVFIMQAV